MAKTPLTIVGCGYTGRRLAIKYLSEGHEMLAIVRSEASRRLLESDGIPVAREDLDRAAGQTHVRPGKSVYMVPPPPRGDTDSRITKWLEAIREPPERIVYLSTTAVYGDHGGARVDETTPTDPTSSAIESRTAASSSTMNTVCSSIPFTARQRET